MVSKQDSIKTAMSTETKTFHKDIKLAVEKGIKDNLDSIKAEIESRNEETEVTKPPSTTTDLGLQQKVREICVNSWTIRTERQNGRHFDIIMVIGEICSLT